MKTKNNNVPNSILDSKQFIFFDFDNGIFVTEPYFVKLMKRTRDKLKYVDINYKKDKLCFSMRKAYCLICGTYHVKLKGYTSHKLIFLNNNKLNVLVQCYKCKKWGKSFQTELTGIVDKYCNFINKIKEKSKFLIVEYLGSLNNVVKSFKELFNISVSHQTIEN